MKMRTFGMAFADCLPWHRAGTVVLLFASDRLVGLHRMAGTSD